MKLHELIHIIKASPTPNVKDFTKEIVTQYGFTLLELNDQATMQELSIRLRNYYDISNIHNKIAYYTLKYADGVVRRSPSKGIEIGFPKNTTHHNFYVN